MGQLEGRVALVTGASRGIGAAIAAAMAGEGAAVVVTARSTDEAPRKLPGTLDETAAAITARGGAVLAVAADLTDATDRERIVATAVERFGRVDILVNNAATTFFVPGAELPQRRARLMFDVQVMAPLHLSQLVLPGMKERGAGWILNISSLEAGAPAVPPSRFDALGTTTVYGMCKAALERMTGGLAAEGFGHGVSVTGLRPGGIVPTPGLVFHGVMEPDDPAAEDPQLMARAAVRLCSAPAAVYSGHVYESTALAGMPGDVVESRT
ncbi:SDR family NAD(P)-dependent oxidoreductase [Nocardia jinanensis]|uniref:Oxidoreductase n=1 Tax=Nocardia jinanensis TaxID=382504 RepID=A0A917RKN3_9NOCA|nr:SDR family NAD(P)-dependent oxidoreductase [Nocardia jinanensis]GGL11923.1 oxidoreductase [Nocardia jinanensis]